MPNRAATSARPQVPPRRLRAGRYARQDDLIGYRAIGVLKCSARLEKTARIIAANRRASRAFASFPCTTFTPAPRNFASSIDAHAARLEGWGVPRAAIDRAVEAAVIVASLTEDAVLAAALLAQAALARIGDPVANRAKSSCTSAPR